MDASKLYAFVTISVNVYRQTPLSPVLSCLMVFTPACVQRRRFKKRPNKEIYLLSFTQTYTTQVSRLEKYFARPCGHEHWKTTKTLLRPHTYANFVHSTIFTEYIGCSCTAAERYQPVGMAKDGISGVCSPSSAFAG